MRGSRSNEFTTKGVSSTSRLGSCGAKPRRFSAPCAVSNGNVPRGTIFEQRNRESEKTTLLSKPPPAEFHLFWGACRSFQERIRAKRQTSKTEGICLRDRLPKQLLIFSGRQEGLLRACISPQGEGQNWTWPGGVSIKAFSAASQFS